MNSFSEMLTWYFGGKQDSFWTRLWLKFCSKQYKARRKRILWKQAKHRQYKLFSEMMPETERFWGNKKLFSTTIIIRHGLISPSKIKEK